MNPRLWKTVPLLVLAAAPVLWAFHLLSRETEDEPALKNSATRSRSTERRPDSARSSDAPRASRRTFPRRRSLASAENDIEPEALQTPDERKVRIAEKIEAAKNLEAAFVEDFHRQSVNATWATTWETSIAGDIEVDLQPLTGFTHSDVECRSTSCLATVTWENYEAARAQLQKTARLGGGCVTSAFMAPTASPDAPYTHRIRFEGCSSVEG